MAELQQRSTVGGVPIVGATGAGNALELTQLPVPAPPTGSVGTSGTVGANLVANLGYTYTLTGVDAAGNETTASAGLLLTEGATAYPLTIQPPAPGSEFSLNLYKNGDFLANLPRQPGNVAYPAYVDSGNVATTGQVAPTQNETALLVAGGNIQLPTDATPDIRSGVLSQQSEQLWCGSGSEAIPVARNPVTLPLSYFW